MPNLNYDPKNPTDLEGTPIQEGDKIAWGCTYGRSPALCIGIIEKINFTTRYGGHGKSYPCAQHEAERYTIRIRPLISTGNITWLDKTGQDRYVRQSDVDADPGRYEAKTTTILVVKNVVKL